MKRMRLCVPHRAKKGKNGFVNGDVERILFEVIGVFFA